MPTLWGYPLAPHDYPYFCVILDPKSKQDKVEVANLKDLPKVEIWIFKKSFACDTPSEVAW